ncbi:MAG: response regulator [Desulfobacterales bacterium]|nr:response regulator [Desulfobacterales bacterium]
MKNKSVSILVIEDNPGDARLIKELLSEIKGISFTAEICQMLSKGIEALTSERFDVVLLNPELLDCSGLESLLKTQAAAPHAAIVVLTGLDDGETAVRLVRKGAQDYLVKGQITPDLLSKAILYAIERKQANEELQKAKEAAEAASQTKSAFLSVISHELRTPLNQIIGFSKILKNDHGLSKKQRAENIDIIHKSGNHLLTIVNDLLDYCKLESGKMKLAVVEINLPEFLERIVTMFQLQTRQKGISLTTDFAPDLPVFVYADMVKLRQVLINILGNAVNFTWKGGVLFRVAPQSGDLIRFLVEDTGIGIPPELSEEIFSPFRQAEYHLHHTKGVGLGLSVSKRLLEMMDSSLHLTSTVDQGSTFWFDARFEKKKQKVSFKCDMYKVLIVADQDADRAMLGDNFTSLGIHHIEKAADEHEASDKGVKCCPDLIFMDIATSEAGRIKAIQQIRQIPEFEDVLIITAISCDTSKCVWDEMNDAGCNDFILKPIDADDLQIMMEIYFG